MIIETPNVELIVQFGHGKEQEDVCRKCHKEVFEIAREMEEAVPLTERKYNHYVEDEGVDFCSEGWYFGLCISFKEKELYDKITKKIMEYGSLT